MHTKHQNKTIQKQVVPHTRSRAALGELSDRGLHDIFCAEFGAPGSAAFEAARENFIVSEAAYAVASYLLQVCADVCGVFFLIFFKGGGLKGGEMCYVMRPGKLFFAQKKNAIERPTQQNSLEKSLLSENKRTTHIKL